MQKPGSEKHTQGTVESFTAGLSPAKRRDRVRHFCCGSCPGIHATIESARAWVSKTESLYSWLHAVRANSILDLKDSADELGRELLC